MAASREPVFRTTRLREGYDLDAVDDFVDRVIEALEGRDLNLSPKQIENEEFKVIRMREGYSMDDVDEWLDEAAAELHQIRTRQRTAANTTSVHTQAMPAAPARPPTPTPTATHNLPPAHTPAPASVAPAMARADTAPTPLPAASLTPPANLTPPEPVAQTPPHLDSHVEPSVTDSAVSELDPVLRALDPTYEEEQETSAPVEPAPPESEPRRGPETQDASEPVNTTPTTGLHHLEIWVRQLDTALHSFGWLFERLGWTLFQAWDTGRSWQAPSGGAYIVLESSSDLTWAAYDRKGPGLNHLALAVPERWMVDRIVSEASTYGWRLMFADLHPHAGGPHHYAAYLENADGYEVEIVAP